MTFWISILILPVVLYAGILTFLFFYQRRLQYFPTHRDSSLKGNREFKPWFSSESSKEFLGYFRKSPKSLQSVLFFHGNKGEALDKAWILDLFDADENDIYLVEYPGFGGKKGKISEKEIQLTAEKALLEVSKRTSAPILLLGESLGSSIAAHLASKFPQNVKKAALISAFPSAEKIGKMLYPYLPVRALMLDKFNTLSHLQKVNIPVCMIHATLDATAPVEWAREMYRTIQASQKLLVEIPGYDHHNLYSAILDSPLAERFRQFIKN